LCPLKRGKTISINGEFVKLGELGRIVESLAYALGDEFYWEYDSFNKLVTQYMSMFIYSDIETFSQQREDREKFEDGIARKAAKLHNILNQKILSIRG